MTTFTLAHLSDTHLGLRQFEARTPTGTNVREQDLVRAYRNVVDDIIRTDPPLVIHSGDVYEAPVVKLRHQKLFQASLETLTRRADGTTRVVIVISGNHDQPSDVREPAAIELNTPIKGVHVVTSTYEQIFLDTDVRLLGADEALTDVVVHALPHDQLRTIDWDLVRPVPGKINILTCHGVVGGSELYMRTKGREYAINAEVLQRGWHYVALGHWHKRGPVPTGQYTTLSTPIWYAGSPENNDFGEAQGPDGTEGRGWLEVEVSNFYDTADDPTPPKVTGHDLPIRAMYTLADVDAQGKTAEVIQAELVAAVAGQELTGTVVRQKVLNADRDEWALVDVDAVRKAAKHTMWYELRHPTGFGVGETPDTDGHASTDLVAALGMAAEELYTEDDDTEQVLALAEKLLTAALASAEPAEEEEKGDAVSKTGASA